MVTAAQLDLRSFLGRKNFKGLYTKNPLSWTPSFHGFDKRKSRLTSFPVRPRHIKDRTVVDWPTVFSEQNATESRQPFPENPHTKSNRLVGAKLRQAIVEAHDEGRSAQQISFSFGLSVLRVEAILKLHQVRKQAESQLSGPQKHLQKDIQKMARTMTSLFDEIPTDDAGKPFRAVDNLTELPMSKETRTQMFQTIAESEPFGPVDAAEMLGIEPANVTLERLTNIEAEQETETAKKNLKTNSFYARLVDGERHLFRFSDAQVGKVGYHYGAARDDQKSGRKVRHLPNGKPAYSKPEHS